MSVTATILIYVADKIVSQFIKEEGYGRIKRFLFPSEKYKNRLSTIVSESVIEFEKSYPLKENGTKFPFYHSQTLFDLLNQHVLSLASRLN